MKKWTHVFASSVLTISLLAGCSAAPTEQNKPSSPQEPTTNQDNKTEPAASGKDLKFSMLTENHPTWPYDPEWPIWQMLKEQTGVSLEVQTAQGNLGESLNLAIASNSMPDLMFMDKLASANKYGQQGALVNILDHLDSMPHLQAWSEKFPESFQQNIASDGNMYMFPNEGFGETNRMIWLYREDIFAKHELAVPTNYDELYATLQELKRLYPDSTPLSFRHGIRILRNMAPNFGIHSEFYYDSDAKQWRYGSTEPEMKALVEALHTFYKEGLISPEWLTMNTKQWQDIMSTDLSFITIDYISRVDFFNDALREENPDFSIQFMAPPAGTPGGTQQNPNLQYLETGLTVASTSKQIDDIMTFMDFFYSEEGRNLASWGKEGVTYAVENGQKKFLPEFTDLTDLRVKTGLASSGTYAWLDFDAHLSMGSEELQHAFAEAAKYDMPRQPMPAFNEQESELLSIKGENIRKAREEGLANFIYGVRDLAEWDKFVSEINSLGLDELLQTYTAAHERMVASAN
ncbi:hypothetical protein PA598K_05124 [Paenibacillus sp. 598K]|uniref:extracellular solute-binding protein n=1 Tax=Paenibacillus sp. 598K TaxID=1117987 RepID=UPI000FFA5403|nr:extracellular solute-binding protein [Paenibacillus sp. 598K]GBF76643.1 hypothetical protein PA598K_05124 [Paenibacillus sp. 598K]